MKKMDMNIFNNIHWKKILRKHQKKYFQDIIEDIHERYIQ